MLSGQEQVSGPDVLIAGGGMVGAALACALGLQDFRVTLVEAREPVRHWSDGPPDLRVSALTRASQRLLTRLGAWEPMARMRVSPYREMQVWDAQGSGSIHFDSADIGEPDLGHIVENRVTQLALWARMDEIPAVRILCPAAVEDMRIEHGRPRVTLENGERIGPRLLVAADGARSNIRAMAGIPTQGWAYSQHAVVATVRTERTHGETAWQRFMADGPLAFLPLNTGECSIVWSTTPERAASLVELDDEAFCRQLSDALDGRLGAVLETGPRASFPLRLLHARRYVEPGLALVGDAAHAVHPLAGQGVNLGLMDVGTLAAVLGEARDRGRDIAALETLRRYERARKGANLGMLAAMDGFKRLFGSSLVPLQLARNLGLDLVDGAGPLKQLIIRHAMGMDGDLPPLAQGDSPADPAR